MGRQMGQQIWMGHVGHVSDRLSALRHSDLRRRLWQRLPDTWERLYLFSCLEHLATSDDLLFCAMQMCTLVLGLIAVLCRRYILLLAE